MEARTKIGPVFRSHFNKCRTKWSMWKDKLDLVWGEYLRYFRFESPEEQSRARGIWEEIAKRNYPKYLHNWKVKAEDEYGSILAARNHKPEWTTLTVWQKLCDYWMSPEFLKASELRKKNRTSRKGIPHTSGNITYEERSLAMFNDLGRAPTQWELFNETHLTKRDGAEKKFVNEEAKDFSETYANKLREANGLEPTQPVNAVEDIGLKIYEKTVGGVQKGRLVGRPGEKWSKRSGNISSSDFAAEVAKQQSAQETKKLREELAAKNAYVLSLYEYMDARAKKYGESPPPRPPNHIATPSSEGASNTRDDYSPTNFVDDEELGDDEEIGDDEGMGNDEDEGVGDEEDEWYSDDAYY